MKKNKIIFVDVKGEDTGYLIGYRGNVLNSLQVILNNIANNELNERARVLLNIGGYKEKREKDLKDLADKIAGTVIKKKKIYYTWTNDIIWKKDNTILNYKKIQKWRHIVLEKSLIEK